MLPITILAAQKLADMLVEGNALQQAILTLGSACSVNVPPIPASQILLATAGARVGARLARMGAAPALR